VAQNPNTLGQQLNLANPNSLADCLRQVALGTVLQPLVEDTGTITASATVVLANAPLIVQSTRVVTSGTAGSEGLYLVGDASATPVAASSGTPGVASLSGSTLTFPNTVTRVITNYLPASATPLTQLFEQGAESVAAPTSPPQPV
jgi:hypothetical protein